MSRTSNFCPLFRLMSCMNSYINVPLGSGCSQSLRGTATWFSILKRFPRFLAVACRVSKVYFSVAVKRATPKGAIMSKRARELGGKGRYREHIGYFGFGVLRSGEERGEDIFRKPGSHCGGAELERGGGRLSRNVPRSLVHIRPACAYGSKYAGLKSYLFKTGSYCSNTCCVRPESVVSCKMVRVTYRGCCRSCTFANVAAHNVI